MYAAGLGCGGRQGSRDVGRLDSQGGGVGFFGGLAVGLSVGLGNPGACEEVVSQHEPRIEPTSKWVLGA